MYVGQHLIFGHGPAMRWTQALDVYLWGHSKPLVYFASTENEQPHHQRIFVPVKPFTTALRLLNGATFHDRECPCVHWFRRRTFSAFFVNCDFINNKNSTFVKFRTWIINVLRQLYVTYWIDEVFTVQPTQLNSKTTHFCKYVCTNFLFVLMSIT